MKYAGCVSSILFCLSIVSRCQAQTLTGTIRNTRKDSFVYFTHWSDRSMQKDSAVVKKGGRFSKTFSFTTPQTMAVRYGTLAKTVYMSPGATLHISFDASNDSLFAHTFSVAGDYGINRYIDSFDLGMHNNFVWSRMDREKPVESMAPVLTAYRRFSDSLRNAYFKRIRRKGGEKALHDFLITDSMQWYANSLLGAMDLLHLMQKGNRSAFFKNEVEKRLPLSFSPLYLNAEFYTRLWYFYFRMASELAQESGDTTGITDNSNGAIALRFIRTKKIKGKLREVIAQQVLNDLLAHYSEQSAEEVRNSDSSIRELLTMVSDVSFIKGYGEDYEAKRQLVRTRLLGTEAPGFSLLDTSGQTVSLNDCKGKLILIDVWASWCVPCIEEMPSLRKVAERLRDKTDFLLLSVSIDNNKEAWLENGVARVHPPGTLLWQGNNNAFSQKYNIALIPQLILIDKEGKYIDFNPPRASDGDKLYELLIKNLAL